MQKRIDFYLDGVIRQNPNLGDKLAKAIKEEKEQIRQDTARDALKIIKLERPMSFLDEGKATWYHRGLKKGKNIMVTLINKKRREFKQKYNI